MGDDDNERASNISHGDMEVNYNMDVNYDYSRHFNATALSPILHPPSPERCQQLPAIPGLLESDSAEDDFDEYLDQLIGDFNRDEGVNETDKIPVSESANFMRVINDIGDLEQLLTHSRYHF